MKKELIFVIDDDIRLHREIAKHFQPLGYVVRGYDSGLAALQAIQLQAPGLVLLEHGLLDAFGRKQHLQGPQIGQDIRRISPSSKIAVISGGHFNPSDWRLVVPTPEAHLEKPFSMTELVTLVTELSPHT